MCQYLDTLRHLLKPNTLDVEAAAAAIDKLPVMAGTEAAMVVTHAHRYIAAVRAGNKRYRPLLRHTIGRLIALLGARVEVAVSQQD